MGSQETNFKEQERQRRALARAGRLTVQVLPLEAEPERRPEAGTSLSRMEQVVELTAAAWSMTGQPWPRLLRSAWPVRVRKLGELA